MAFHKTLFNELESLFARNKSALVNFKTRSGLPGNTSVYIFYNRLKKISLDIALQQRIALPKEDEVTYTTSKRLVFTSHKTLFGSLKVLTTQLWNAAPFTKTFLVHF